MKHERGDRQAGLTVLELLVSMMASAIIILSIGRIAVTNTTMIREGRDQIVLQQEVNLLLNRVARDVRAAERVTRVSANEFRTVAGGAVQHVYRLQGSGDAARFQRDGVDMLDRTCSGLTAISTADSTTLDIRLTVTDVHGNSAVGFTSTVVRNNNLGF